METYSEDLIGKALDKEYQDGYNKAKNDCIKACKEEYDEMVFRKDLPTHIKLHKRSEITAIIEKITQLKERK